ncbi:MULTISPECIES: hypothetical protein [Kitasatospora]|uniref:Cobyrinic acid a,c-diamide synthase n=1 Tax=Kitasatospora setae (strain ATCC 33774 / DSM 43861 / JCM 3304 / KCC A-0304 / NBRC 14216 / KM-6054) TaxID=452652 RepID=E4N3P0_KITSK|nr:MULTISPECIES: hypothetical protein [Kitasatospora]BAJ31521.1 hypothetical protein KSE_57480 [Kitasatospora setae KM-6054]
MALSPSLARNGNGNGTGPANPPAPAGQDGPADGRTADVPAARPEAAPAAAAGRAEDPAEAVRRAAQAQQAQAQAQQAPGPPRGRGRPRRPSGRERHDEKITVYVSAEELMDLEHARLVLRGEHGLAVDRGRIVREAIAVVLADMEQRGEASILVRRLRGR